jgi:hypothetical protein
LSEIAVSLQASSDWPMGQVSCWGLGWHLHQDQE